MFLLHERTRKTYCRLGFLALCAAPAFGAALWAASRTSEEHRETCAADLGKLLRMSATVEEVTHPRPGSVRYDGLALADPETREPVASVASLTIRDEEAVTSLIASGVVLYGERAGLIWDAIVAQLRAMGDQADLRLIATDVEVTLPGSSFPLTDLRGGIDRARERSAAWISFRGADSTAESKPIVARVVRQRGEEGIQIGFELSTSESTLPLPLLSAVASSQKRDKFLSLDSGRFSGQIKAVHDADGWRGEIDCRITDVDFGRELCERFGHRLTAIAQIELAPAVFRAGRLEHARGRVTAGRGSIGESLLASAASALGMERVGRGSGQADLVEFDQLAFEFVADASAIVIKGRCVDTHPAAILAHQGKPMLLEAAGPSGPPVQLIHALAPPNSLLVPAGRETEALLRVLPAAPVVRR
jgi:hypothetical protein